MTTRAARGGNGRRVLGVAAGVALAAGAYTYMTQDIVMCEPVPRPNAVMDFQRYATLVEAGKTNSAFVFIKPHALKGNPGEVEALVKAKFADCGITVTDEGVYAAETIDEQKFIDNHYGAIASKAVLLKPSELNVPDKGKAAFEKMFGLSWDDAVAQGLVYNAADGAEKLGVDGFGLENKWRGLTRGEDLIKFGGGFYCGKVDDIFVMNGFYMSMRAAYCSPGEKIHWMTVSWPAKDLSWADFRGVVLGATNPSEAAEGSVRRTILELYEVLGLQSKPNTGDNGVHASASPFEALAERMNWLGASVEEDTFGKGLLAAGIPKETIQAWTQDPQVLVQGAAKPGSLFDYLEDKNSMTCLADALKVEK